jgi:hypothetical protein
VSTDLTGFDLEVVAASLDASRNLGGARLGTEARARIFRAIESGTYEAWNDARSVVVGRDGTPLTFWQAVAAHTGDPAAQPTPTQMIAALAAATGVSA